MTSAPDRPLSRPLEALLAFAVVLFALWFADRHVRDNLVHPPAALDLLCRGEGEIPYQHRVLVPWLVERVHASGIVSSLLETRMAIAQALEAVILVVLYYVLRALISRFVGRGMRGALAALLLAYVLPFNYLLPRNWPFWYAWDVPAILFFALGMLSIHRRDWRLYYPVFALATVNRETTCFLGLIFVLVSLGSMPLWKLVPHAAAQAAIWWAITAAIRSEYAGNPGVGAYYGFALRDNLAMIREPRNWLLLASVFGFLWLPLALLGHRIEDLFARRALLAVPVYFAASFFTAVFDELRIFGEMIPPVLLGIACLARALLSPAPPDQRDSCLT